MYSQIDTSKLTRAGRFLLDDITLVSYQSADGSNKNAKSISIRSQVLEIDLSNTSISGGVDTIATGGSSAGVGVATTSSYTGASSTSSSTSTSSTSASSSSSSSSGSSSSGSSGSSGY